MFKNIGLPLEKIDSQNLILDIDLDYFLERANFDLDLTANTVFSNLVRQARIITVARSKSYFEFLKNDNFTIEICEKMLINLLEKSLS